MAPFHAAPLVSSDEPFRTPSIVSWPDASGSGNPRTPFSRMHSETRTALPRAVVFFVVAVPAVSEGASEPQPAQIRATAARAGSVRLRLTAASSDRASG